MRTYLRDFCINQAGNVAVIFALSALPLLAAIGAAVDYASANSARTVMQSALDSATLATAPLADNLSHEEIRKNVQKVFLANSTQSDLTKTKIKTWYSSDSNKLSAEVSASMPTTFMSVVGIDSISLDVKSTAKLGAAAGSSACLMALDSSATPNVKGIIGAGSGALNASGSGTINLTGCNIYVNSTSDQSIDVTGGGAISADYVYTSGDYSGNVVATKAPDQAPTTHATSASDPYATTRSIPSWSSCDSSATSWSGSISNPSGVLVICGDVKVTADTTLDPGVYIIVDGSLTSSKPISGNGVTMILTSKNPSADNGIFQFKSGATLNLTAPSSGSTAGIVFWADAALPHNADGFYAGTTGNIVGAIYLPSHLVNYSGSAKAGSACTQLIAAEIAVSGGASFEHQCSGVGVLDPTTGTGVAYLSK